MLRILIPRRVVGYFLSLPLISAQSNTQSHTHAQSQTYMYSSTQSSKQGSVRPACSTAGVEDTDEDNIDNMIYKKQVYENGIELDP